MKNQKDTQDQATPRHPSDHMIYSIASHAIFSIGDVFHDPDPGQDDIRDEAIAAVVDAISRALCVELYVYKDRETAARVAATIKHQYGVITFTCGSAIECPSDIMTRALEETHIPPAFWVR